MGVSIGIGPSHFAWLSLPPQPDSSASSPQLAKWPGLTFFWREKLYEHILHNLVLLSIQNLVILLFRPILHIFDNQNNHGIQIAQSSKIPFTNERKEIEEL